MWQLPIPRMFLALDSISKIASDTKIRGALSNCTQKTVCAEHLRAPWSALKTAPAC